MWGEIYDRVADLIRAHRTTLIFVGTRRMSERVAFALTERLGEGVVMPHHGSLSRELRFDAEQRLKNGELRAVVATASLELGIDIGSVDLVVQLGSPRSIAVALQRIGRSGHWVGAMPKGRLLRDDARRTDRVRRARARDSRRRAGRAADPERAARHPRAADRRRVRAATNGTSNALRARAAARSPIATSNAATSTRSSTMLADGIATSRGRSGTFLHYDRVNGDAARRGAARGWPRSPAAARSRIPPTIKSSPSPRARRSARSTRISPSRAWPATSSCSARTRGGSGASRPASFASRTRTARRRRFRSGTAKGAGRTIELSREVCAVRAAIDERDDEAAIAWLDAECALDRRGRRAGRRVRSRRQEDPRRRADGHGRSSPSASSTKAAACS